MKNYYNDKIRKKEEEIERLQAARDGLKKYKVPLTYDNYHNGNVEHTHIIIWARNEKEAKEKAATNHHGIKWADIDGLIIQLEGIPSL